MVIFVYVFLQKGTVLLIAGGNLLPHGPFQGLERQLKVLVGKFLEVFSVEGIWLLPAGAAAAVGDILQLQGCFLDRSCLLLLVHDAYVSELFFAVLLLQD